MNCHFNGNYCKVVKLENEAEFRLYINMYVNMYDFIIAVRASSRSPLSTIIPETKFVYASSVVQCKYNYD